ncbi:neurotrimin [Diachasma alloeum]|uniref:neurotrimin n=1 Tax=Diachasma alloeum TaxID=454923 RepID=UPI00073848C7|nr:neurotrimin [Diachasma alloeum]
MQTLGIAAILALLFTAHVLGRPQNADRTYDDYPGDELKEYDDPEDPEEQDTGRGTSSPIPVIQSQALNLKARPGDKVEFPCVISNGENDVIQWTKGSEPLFFGGTVTTDEPERIKLTRSNSLVIDPVTELDTSNQWTCSVLVEPPVILKHSLVVEHGPTDLTNPTAPPDQQPLKVWPGKKIMVNESMTVKFGCESQSKTKPEIKWSLKGKTIDEVQGTRRENNYVFIEHATRHHAGVYQCLAEDRSASPQHEAIEVVVNYSPFIELEHDTFHTGLGMMSEISCEVDAHPHGHLKWYKNGNIVSKVGTTHKHEKTSTGKTLHKLIIEHTHKEDLGTYTCRATNELGDASKEVILTGAPAKPILNHGEDLNNQKAHMVRWRVQSFSPITEYKLEYRMKGEDKWIEVKPQVKDGQENNFFVENHFENLLPGVYQVRLLARNDFGWSPQSSIHEFRKEIVADVPQNVKGAGGGSSTTRPLAALTALLLVVSTRVFTCL